MGSLTVSDADSPQLTELRYLIVEGNEGGRFTVDPITCSISTSGLIDREEREVYNLIIEVCSHSRCVLYSLCVVLGKNGCILYPFISLFPSPPSLSPPPFPRLVMLHSSS